MKYDSKDYVAAIEYHEKVHGESKYFSLGNDYYRLGDLEKSLEYFSYLDTAESLYNGGNIMYMFGEESSDIEEKKSLWNQSLRFYMQSLEKKNSQKTQENHDFVERKLEELLEEQEQGQGSEEENEEESEENQGDSGNAQESDPEERGEEEVSEWEQTEAGNEASEWQEWEWWNQDTPIPQPRWEEYKLSEASEAPSLTPQEEADLENYIDRLKEEEKRNQRHFNKNEQDSSSNDIFDSFTSWFGDQFDRWGEKDW